MSLTNNGSWDDSLLWDDLDSWQDRPTVDSALNGYRFSGLPINGVAPATTLFEYQAYVVDSDSLNSNPFSSLVNGAGIPAELRPKTDPASLLNFIQRITVSGQGSVQDIENIVNNTELSDNFLSIEQSTSIIGVGGVFDVWQTVEYRAVVDVPEQIASFNQTIARQEAVGSILYLSQRVRDLSIYTQQYKPFEIDLSVGGYLFQDSELYGEMTITRAENDATILSFSILVPEGDVNSYVEVQGKEVILDYTDNNTGKTDRLFTGVVNIPEIDFVEGIASYSCTDNRREAINKLSRTTISQYGYWSEDVFGERPDEIFDEVEDRLETIPYAFDMNRFGNLQLVAWEPKSTGVRVFGNSDVFRRKPTVEVLSRSRVVNKVNIEMEFQYQRLRYREQKYNFSGTYRVCDYFSIGPPVEKAMIHEALGQTSWDYKDMQTVTAQCGSARCFGFSLYRSPCGTYQGYQEPQVDVDGEPILDSEGNQVTEFKATSYTDVSQKYAGTARWTSFIRFAQNISEKITISVEAPQSIAQYSPITFTPVERNQTMGVTIDYDTKDYEDMKYTYDLSNFSTSSNGDLYLDLAYLVAENGAGRWKDAYDCAINRAKTTIIKSHRDNTATFEMNIIPDLELSDTVQIDSVDNSWTTCKGKVGSITHTINMDDREAYTEVEIKLSRTIGSPPVEVTPNYEAARPQNRDDTPSDPETIQLKTKIIGKDEELTEAMVGAIYRQATYNVLAAFAVNTPSISESRDTKEFTSSSTIQIPIRNDNLTIRHKR